MKLKSYIQVLGSAKFLRAFHGWCTIFWIPLTLLAFGLGWLESVTFVSLISMVALFLGSFSAWQGSRTEVLQGKLDPDTDDKSVREAFDDVKRS